MDSNDYPTAAQWLPEHSKHEDLETGQALPRVDVATQTTPPQSDCVGTQDTALTQTQDSHRSPSLVSNEGSSQRRSDAGAVASGDAAAGMAVAQQPQHREVHIIINDHIDNMGQISKVLPGGRSVRVDGDDVPQWAHELFKKGHRCANWAWKMTEEPIQDLRRRSEWLQGQVDSGSAPGSAPEAPYAVHEAASGAVHEAASGAAPCAIFNPQVRLCSWFDQKA